MVSPVWIYIYAKYILLAAMKPRPHTVLHRKLAMLYPVDAARLAAEHALAPVLRGAEGTRVALGCVKLAGSDLKKLENVARAAGVDYRDILAWAESPRQMRLEPSAPADDRARACRADVQEYESWLRAP